MRSGTKMKGLGGLLSAIMAVILMVTIGSIKVNAAGATLSLSNDATYNSSELAGYTELNLNGHKLTVEGNFVTNATITTGRNGSLIVNGNMTINGQMNCTEGYLTVNGDYTQKSSSLWLNASNVTINGNVKFEGSGYFDELYSGGKTKITVSGNLVYDSTNNSMSNMFTTGELTTWIVSGDVIQGDDTGSFTVGHLTLNGKNKQSLSFNRNSYIYNLNIKNDKIKVTNYLNALRVYGSLTPELDKSFKTRVFNLLEGEWVFNKSVDVDGYLNVYDNCKITINGNYTNVGGDGNTRTGCEKGEFIVKGNLVQTPGRLYLSSAKMTIQGNLVLDKKGFIDADNESKVYLNGDLTYSSDGNTSNNVAEWHVKGNVTQTEGAGDYYTGKLYLEGDKKQTVTVQNNSVMSDFYPKNSNVAFCGPIRYAVIKCDFNPEFLYSSSVTLTNVSIKGVNVVIPNNVMIKDSLYVSNGGVLTINGNVSSTGGVGVDSSKLIVNGDFEHKAKGLSVDNSEMNVSGSLSILENGYLNGASNSKISIGKDLIYNSLEKTKNDLTEITVSRNLIQESESAEADFSKIFMTSKGSKIKLVNGIIHTLRLKYAKSDFVIDSDDCYEKLIATLTVTLDGNGIDISENTMTVTTGDTYKDLPYPKRDGYRFDGWSLSKEGGDYISDYMEIKAVDNQTLYAHWTELVSINKAEISLSQMNYDYDGKAKAPDVTVKYNGETLKKDSDYRLWYSDNVEPGTAKVTVTGIGSFKDSEVLEYTIKVSTPEFGWYYAEGRAFWYENGSRQGTFDDANGVIGDGTIRGREIYDPDSDGWYWLDSIYDGAKAVGKEVWMPYIYQNEDSWDDETKRNIAYESDEGMGECVLNAINSKAGKWVRYDENGRMLKGWVTIEGKLADIYPDQTGNTYYYDNRTGLMAKGWVTLDGKTYYFDEVSGALVP